MSPQILVLLLVAGLTVTNLVEAWLEDIVIRLKDPRLAEGPLNDKEHSRSMVYSGLVASPYLVASIALGFYWLIAVVIINRRLVFDTALKFYRDRPLGRYERLKGVDGFMAGIFGKNGAVLEITLEAAASAALVVFQFIHL